MRLLKQIPYILCAVILIIFMATTKAALDTERQINDLRYAEQQEAIQSLTAALQEQQEQMTKLSRTISELQSQIDDMKFEPLDIPLPVGLQEHTYNESQRIGIDPNIIFALMYRESRFQTDVSCLDSNGYESIGLCQINGMTFDFLTERGIDWTTPEGNISAACELIAYYRDERGYSLVEALACYGAGETGMLRGEGLEAAKKLLEAVV